MSTKLKILLAVDDPYLSRYIQTSPPIEENGRRFEFPVQTSCRG